MTVVNYDWLNELCLSYSGKTKTSQAQLVMQVLTPILELVSIDEIIFSIYSYFLGLYIV